MEEGQTGWHIPTLAMKGTISSRVEAEVRGEPVTCLASTFACCGVSSDALYIPETVKYMFCSFRATSFLKDCDELKIPRTVKYASHLIQGSRAMIDDFKFYFPSSILSTSQNVYAGDHNPWFENELY